MVIPLKLALYMGLLSCEAHDYPTAMANTYPIPAGKVLATIIGLLTPKEPENRIQILRNCTARIEEDTDNSGWNDSIGYVFLLEMSAEMLGSLEGQLENIEKTISDKLHFISRSTPGHWIGCVHTVPIMSQDNSPIVADSKSVARIWVPNQLRLFISHRSENKETATDLSLKLADYGITAFVAHAHIEPSEEWSLEILNALRSMQALLALITPEFHQSPWTNQEVGFALATGVPIIPICIDGTLPQGFVAKVQGMKVAAEYVNGIASEIADALSKKDQTTGELRSALIERLIHSPSFLTTSIIYKRLLKMPPITKDEAERLKVAFQNNEVANYFYGDKIKGWIQAHFPKFGKPEETTPLLPDEDDIPF